MKKKGVVILLILMILSSLSSAQVNLEQGLVGWYSFDQIADSIVVNQAAAENKGPNGIIVADTTTGETPEIVGGVSGNALWFSTENTAHVSLGIYDPSVDTDELAISCWINWEGLDGTWQPIAGLRNAWDPPTIGWSMVLDQNSGGLQFETNTPNGKVFIITPEPPPEQEWVHIVLNFDSRYATYYFDADWVVDGEMTFGEGRSTATFRIGAGWTGGNGFKGTIDEFRIYNRILTAEEIKFLHDNPGGTADVVEFNTSVPTEFSLENYPNPFNPSTTISFSLYRTDYVSLNVYNMLGEHVAVLVNEIKNAGAHTVHFNADDLPGGIYLYRLTVGSSIEQAAKMLLLK